MFEFFSNAGGSLGAEIKAITPDQFVDPPKHDGIFEVFGETMTGPEKAIYTVITRLRTRIDKNVEMLKSNETPSNKKGLITAETRELSTKCSMAKDSMFFSIRDRLNIWDKSLSVSQGFKIVIPEQKEVVVREIDVSGDLSVELVRLLKSITGSREDEMDSFMPEGATVH